METCRPNNSDSSRDRFKSYYVVWKLKFFCIIDAHQRGLNRTMQYGNYFPTNILPRSYFCLNRTMQYGNEYPTLSSFSPTFEFKSYYVVWKQTKGEGISQGDVWGLNRTMQYGNYNCGICYISVLRFKSYYVVWKLQMQPSITIILQCLNRTMQYGNFQFCNFPNFRIPGLNRTMQYGNFSHEAYAMSYVHV